MEPRKPYPTDLTDREWALIEPYVPQAKPGGRPDKYPKREILNGIFYIVRGGCAWRLLPHNFPPWESVYHYFRAWRQDGKWDLMNDLLRGDVRKATGKNRQPSAGVIDSQSAKTREGGKKRVHGYDTYKHVNGRKRHILVDTLGLLLAVVVTAANVQDRDGAMQLLDILRCKLSRLRLIWADQAYTGWPVAWVWSLRPWRKVRLEIVKRADGAKGFHVLPKRWIVVMSHLMIRRLARMVTC